eukprot:852642-Pelagomonas_calceolata.AAC.3
MAKTYPEQCCIVNRQRHVSPKCKLHIPVPGPLSYPLFAAPWHPFSGSAAASAAQPWHPASA